MRLPNKKFWLLLFLFILTLSGLVISLVLVEQRQLYQKKAAEGENSSLSLPSSKTVSQGETFSLPVMLNTDGKPIVGVDVILNFDTNLLELIDILEGNCSSVDCTPPFEIYLPVSGGELDKERIKNQANSLGKIELGAIKYGDGQIGSFNGVLNEGNPLTTLVFRAKTAGTTQVRFFFQGRGVTTDSNLVTIEGEVTRDILAQVNNLSLTINEGGVSPSPTPTSTPTPSPSPRLTPTPTPTLSSGKTTLTFKLKFEGISEQKPRKQVKVVLTQNGVEKYSFNQVEVSFDSSGIAQGTISNLDPGTYDLYIKGWAHLTKKFENINLASSPNTLDFTNQPLLAGDANGDDQINIQDFNILVRDYGLESSLADFNLDNKVNIQDFRFIVKNYGEEGE